jgi:hypothetical protein
MHNDDDGDDNDNGGECDLVLDWTGDQMCKLLTLVDTAYQVSASLMVTGNAEVSGPLLLAQQATQ